MDWTLFLQIFGLAVAGLVIWLFVAAYRLTVQKEARIVRLSAGESEALIKARHLLDSGGDRVSTFHLDAVLRRVEVEGRDG